MEPESKGAESQPEKKLTATPAFSRLESSLSAEESQKWHATLRAGGRAQRIVVGAVAVGGTAAALYAGHRISHDVDNLLSALKEEFDSVLETLEQAPEWKTARTKKPVLILGSIDDVEIGFRHMRRTQPIQSIASETSQGKLVIPTLREMLGMKAFLAYSRNAVRDYLDFAALTTCVEEAQVLEALGDLDPIYGHLQTASVALEVAKALSKPEPFDLEGMDLSYYRALVPEWRDWRRIEGICTRYGGLLGQKLMET